jgi:hypothetical protein
MFHQIGYRLYNYNVQLQSFSLPLSENERQALDKVKTVWSDPQPLVKNPDASVSTSTRQFVLKPGETVTMFESDKPGRITGFEIVSQSTLDTIAKNIDMRITWGMMINNLRYIARWQTILVMLLQELPW